MAQIHAGGRHESEIAGMSRLFAGELLTLKTGLSNIDDDWQDRGVDPLTPDIG
jgi:hypothetical protein